MVSADKPGNRQAWPSRDQWRNNGNRLRTVSEVRPLLASRRRSSSEGRRAVYFRRLLSSRLEFYPLAITVPCVLGPMRRRRTPALSIAAHRGFLLVDEPNKNESSAANESVAQGTRGQGAPSNNQYEQLSQEKDDGHDFECSRSITWAQLLSLSTCMAGRT